jgi:hypothetical protein
MCFYFYFYFSNFKRLWTHNHRLVKYMYMYMSMRRCEFSLLHIFSLVLQPWMSAYIRKTDGVYI